MPILNYSTQIDSMKTIGEVQKVLVSHGAKKIITDFDDDGTPKALTFQLSVKDQVVAYSLPANWNGVLKAMEKQKVPKKFINKEQAIRISWRILKDWVEAQMAIVESELAGMAEVFLPYTVMKTGNTLYQEIESGSLKRMLE